MEVKSADKYTEGSGQEKPKFSDIYRIFVNTSGTKLACINTKSSLEAERPETKELSGSRCGSPSSWIWAQNICSLQLHHQHFAAFRELLALLSTFKKNPKIASRMKKHQIHSCNVLKTFKSSPEFRLRLFLADGAVFGGRGKTPKSNTIKKSVQWRWLRFKQNKLSHVG